MIIDIEYDPKDTQNFITSKKHVKEILKYTNLNYSYLFYISAERHTV